MEVVSQLYLALDEKYLGECAFRALADEADVLAAKIAELAKSRGRNPRIAEHTRGSSAYGRVLCTELSTLDSRLSTPLSLRPRLPQPVSET